MLTSLSKIPKIRRLSQTIVDADDSLLNEDSRSLTEHDQEEVSATTKANERLISHETVRRTYTVPQGGKFATDFLDSDLLGIIGSLTNCQFEFKETKGDIIVKGESEEEVERTMKKLEVIDNAEVNSMIYVYEIALSILVSAQYWQLEF